MKTKLCAMIGALLSLSFNCHALEDVGQLLFRWPEPKADVLCELKDLDVWMHNNDEGRYRGTVVTDRLGSLCMVRMDKKVFYKRYRFCSLAFVEGNRHLDYVCGVNHFATDVEFSFGYRVDKGSPSTIDEPMCAFVCQRR